MSELKRKAISHREREREKDKCPYNIKYQVTKMWFQQDTPQASTSSLPKNRFFPLQKNTPFLFVKASEHPTGGPSHPLCDSAEHVHCLQNLSGFDSCICITQRGSAVFVGGCWLKPRGQMNVSNILGNTWAFFLGCEKWCHLYNVVKKHSWNGK